MAQFKQASILFVEAQFVFLCIDGLNAFEQRVIQSDRIVFSRQHRRRNGPDFLNFVVVFRSGNIEKRR